MKRIKRFAIVIIFCFVGLVSFGQKDTVFSSQIYVDESTYLVSEKVLEFDSLYVDELMARFETWGGQDFRDYGEVQITKTDSQIILSYITPDFQVAEMYLIMIVDFKDSKIRVRIYDDGNVYLAGRWVTKLGETSTYIPGAAARQFKVISYFSKGMIIHKTKPGKFNIKLPHAMGSLSYKEGVDNTIRVLDNYIRNYSTTFKENSDW